MSVTVSEVLVAARSGLAAVSSETAGYLVLGTADCLGDAPIGIASVYLDEDGALRLDRRAEPAAFDSETGLRTVLKRLLETGRSPAPALLRVASTSEKRGVRRLITEIEAALIPVNRSAARRALARLHRDVLRGKEAGKLPAPAEELFLPEPSAVPPRAAPVPPAVVEKPVVVEKTSTEGPTPVVPIVEPVPIVVAHEEPQELSLVETLEPSPAPWVDYVPEATPFLGSLVTAPRDFVALAPVADVEIDAPDTDRAPPVSLDEAGDTPRFAGETAVLGTYGASPAALPVSLEIPVEVALPEESLDELSDEAPPDLANDEPAEILDAAPPVGEDVAIPQYEVSAEPFEPVFAREAGVIESAAAVDEENEARDALEQALLDFGDGDDVPVSVKPVDDSGEGVAPMFELLPKRVESAPVVEEADAAMEALIDEALAVLSEAVEEEPSPFSVPSPLPRVSAVVYESGTMPGLGFVNIALVAANVQEIPSLVPPRVAPVEPAAEPALAAPAVIEESVAEPAVIEESVAAPAVIEESVAAPAVIEESVAEPAVIEPAIAEFEALSDAFDFDVFEPAIAELAVEPDVPAPVAAAHPGEAFLADDLADEYAADDYSAVEYAPVEYAVKVAETAATLLDAGEPAEEAASEPSEWPSAVSESGVVVSKPPPIDEPEAVVSEDPPAIVEPEDEPVIIPAAEAPSYRPRRSEVADLVAAFVVAESRTLSELTRELKRIAGLGATPAPPEVAPEPVHRKVSSAR